MHSIYEPKKRGRKSNRYKRYFKAHPAPQHHWIVGMEAQWSATYIKPLDHSIRTVDNKMVVTYYRRINN